jgi:hypothetical protein
MLYHDDRTGEFLDQWTDLSVLNMAETSVLTAIGGLPGIVGKLNYLQSLGVTALCSITRCSAGGERPTRPLR